VLIIGGASGTGKSTIAYEIAKHYGISVLELDDIHCVVKSLVSVDKYPAICDLNGDKWRELGVDWNVKWLKDVTISEGQQDFMMDYMRNCMITSFIRLSFARFVVHCS